MRTPAPALAPLFRSEQQLEILGYLFVVVDVPRSIQEITTATQVPASSVSREVKRLVEHDILHATSLGTMRLVEPNWSLPWAQDLARLLAKTIGPLGVLADELASFRLQIQEAWIYGSWAERFEGTPGPFPRDVDVLVIGDLPLADAYGVARRCERRLGSGAEVNPTVVSPAAWAGRAGDPFLSTVAERAMVPIPLAAMS